MKKKTLLLSLFGGVVALVAIVALVLFAINPALRENYAKTYTTGDMHLFLREGKGLLSADGFFLPVGYFRETEPSHSLRLGKTGEMTLWIWATGDEDLEITDVSAEALWSFEDGAVDAEKYFSIGAWDEKIPAGQAATVRITFSPDAEMSAGLWRALLSVTAKTVDGEIRRTYAVDMQIPGETRVTLCSGKKSDWVIVEKSDPTAAERAAVDIFARTIRKTTGCELEIRQDSVPARGKEIVIGYGSRISGDDEIAALGTENGYIGITHDRVILTGLTDRGTLYAVYSFLEEYCGLRQLTEEISVSNAARSLVLNTGVRIVSADFGLRGVFSGEGDDWQFAMPNMLNAGQLENGAQYGGSITYAGDALQTMEELIPSNQYYYTNRAFYSSRGVSENGLRQLCLSNPDVASRILDKVIMLLDGNSLAQRVSLRHIGSATPCDCENCRAVNAAEGSSAGTYVRLINIVADKVAEKYPGVLLEIELSGASCALPKTRLADNVLVLLSDAGTTRGENYAENGFLETVKRWNVNTAHVGVAVQIFADDQYLCPVTDMTTLGENMQLLWECDAEACLFGDCGSVTGAEFGGLKAYVAARLARDADYPASLAVHDYLYGVYGAAGGYVGDYLEILGAQLAEKKPAADAAASAAVYEDAFITAGEDLFALAEKRCGGDGERLYRIRREALALRWLKLKLTPANARDEVFAAEVERFFVDVEHYGITSLTGQRLSAEKAALLGR